MPHHFHRTRTLVAGLAAALLLSACGSGSPSAQSTSAQSTESPGATSSAPATSAATVAATTSSEAGASAASSSTVEPSSPQSATSAAATTSEASPSAPTGGGTVTLITHDSFNLDKKMVAEFEKSSGIKLVLLAQGDAGAMTNKLVLTKDKPLGDLAFGVDNTFATRALKAGVFQPYAAPASKNGADRFDVEQDSMLTAVDYSDVCINVDHAYFTNAKLAEPKSLEDLAKPEYKNLLVVPSPATSSPGLAFLLATIGKFGADGWQDYWKSLRANGVKVTGGWNDAYSVDFSGSAGKGKRPIVLSYASSPPFEVKDPAKPAPTSALLDTCFRQVEYAGILTGAANPEGAKKVIDFLLSPEVQASLPTQMYVYPVDQQAEVPADWKKFAPQAEKPFTVDPDQITAHREEWIDTWTELMEG